MCVIQLETHMHAHTYTETFMLEEMKGSEDEAGWEQNLSSTPCLCPPLSSWAVHMFSLALPRLQCKTLPALTRANTLLKFHHSRRFSLVLLPTRLLKATRWKIPLHSLTLTYSYLRIWLVGWINCNALSSCQPRTKSKDPPSGRRLAQTHQFQ